MTMLLVMMVVAIVALILNQVKLLHDMDDMKYLSGIKNVELMKESLLKMGECFESQLQLNSKYNARLALLEHAFDEAQKQKQEQHQGNATK